MPTGGGSDEVFVHGVGGEGPVVALAFDATSVYVTNGPSLLRVPIAGGAPTNATTAPCWQAPDRFVVAGDSIFFSTSVGIWRACK